MTTKKTWKKSSKAKPEKPSAKKAELEKIESPEPEVIEPAPAPKAKVPAPGGPDGDPRVKGPEPLPEYKTSGPSGEFGVPSEEPLFKDDEPGIRLKNLVNRPAFVNLPHEDYCEKIGRCVCAERDVYREEQIERGSKAQRRVIKRLRMPKSIRIPALGLSEPLNRAATKCPDIERKLSIRPQKLKIMPV